MHAIHSSLKVFASPALIGMHMSESIQLDTNVSAWDNFLITVDLFSIIQHQELLLEMWPSLGPLLRPWWCHGFP